MKKHLVFYFYLNQNQQKRTTSTKNDGKKKTNERKWKAMVNGRVCNEYLSLRAKTCSQRGPLQLKPPLHCMLRSSLACRASCLDAEKFMLSSLKDNWMSGTNANTRLRLSHTHTHTLTTTTEQTLHKFLKWNGKNKNRRDEIVIIKTCKSSSKAVTAGTCALCALALHGLHNVCVCVLCWHEFWVCGVQCPPHCCNNLQLIPNDDIRFHINAVHFNFDVVCWWCAVTLLRSGAKWRYAESIKYKIKMFFFCCDGSDRRRRQRRMGRKLNAKNE